MKRSERPECRCAGGFLQQVKRKASVMVKACLKPCKPKNLTLKGDYSRFPDFWMFGSVIEIKGLFFFSTQIEVLLCVCWEKEFKGTWVYFNTHSVITDEPRKLRSHTSIDID